MGNQSYTLVSRPTLVTSGKNSAHFDHPGSVVEISSTYSSVGDGSFALGDVIVDCQVSCEM